MNSLVFLNEIPLRNELWANIFFLISESFSSKQIEKGVDYYSALQVSNLITLSDTFYFSRKLLKLLSLYKYHFYICYNQNY